MVADAAAYHIAQKISVPDNILLLFLSIAPTLTPQENIWIIFDSMDAVESQLIMALQHIDSNPDIVKSISS